MNWTEFKLKFLSLTVEQEEMIDQLEKRPDHEETIRKAGLMNGHAFPLVFCEDVDGPALVRPDGSVKWLTRPSQ